jgi:hypothetical protein
MSGHRGLVARDSENLGRIDLRDRQATARFRPGPALGPRSLCWVSSPPPGEGRAWWSEVTLLPGRDQLDAPGSLCSVGAGGRRVQQCQVKGDKNGDS